MTEPLHLPGATAKSELYPYQTLPVRFVERNGEKELVLNDVLKVLGIVGKPDVDDVIAGESRQVRLDNREPATVVTLAGVAALISQFGGFEDPAHDDFYVWARRTFGPRPARQLKGPDASRWGWQPIRKVVKQAGLSGRAFVEKANALDLPHVETFSAGNYAAWSYGGCLPRESLVRRAEALFGIPREELFTEDVLKNLSHRGKGKRHPPAMFKSEIKSDTEPE